MQEAFINSVKECAFPRKLSILLEEDYEDASGNFFSVCSPQSFLNKKRKVSPSCTAKTQTDLSISVNPPTLFRKQLFSSNGKSDLPIMEKCFPRCGFTIVSQTVQKKTIYSEELPKRLVLRYPPPYTKKKARSISSRDNDLKPRIQMNKWFTMSPSRSESSHNLTLGSQNSRLQTRHLSLEKQESFSSCDPSLYPDSRMSSVTDCSGWITKSDVELNLRPEPPSYQQSIASQRRNRWLSV
ncbi:uncharacterized protein CDAR_450181 [Caerostris darwini]|uniref:Uncharacterized protein n=1 Tax=Caerostris darwini TaxID=1538125 RepID=A0AAV4QS65_9ARAC|nr:uncharacterized protein CDAR_450181 [Caerostris darwini]